MPTAYSRPKTSPINVFLDDGTELPLPVEYAVCPRCAGHGTTVNPAIDGHGLSREDFDEDPDFADAYFAGVYDVPCARCKGQRVVPSIDEARCDPLALAMYRRQQKELADLRADERSESFLHGEG